MKAMWLRLSERAWVGYKFQGYGFCLPPDYQQVQGGFCEPKVMEFEAKSAFVSSSSPTTDEWGVDTTFRDDKLIAHLTKRFDELDFCFLDGRLCVDSKQPRRVHDLYSSVGFQFHFFAQRTKHQAWTFTGPRALFRRSHVRRSMCPDVAVVETSELERCMSLLHSGQQLPVDVQGLICFQVATAEDDDAMVHAKCQQMVNVFSASFVVGLFVKTGSVCTYFQGRRHTEHVNPQFVDLGEVVQGLRFYLRPLCMQAGEAGVDDDVSLWPFRPNCSCGLDWQDLLPEEVESAVCHLISSGNDDCALEGVNFLGSGVNYKDCRGRTPMVVAATLDKVDLLKELHVQGGDVHFTDAREVSPVQAAVWTSRGAGACVKWLAARGVDTSPPTVEDVFSSVGCVPRLELVLAAGAPVVGFNKNGVSPLFVAIRMHSVEAVKVLVAAGSPIDKVTDRGNSALRMALSAIGGGEPANEIVRFFLNAGAKPDEVDLEVAKTFGFSEVLGSYANAKR